MGSPNGADVIVVGAVRVERRTDVGWFCEIDGQRVFVAELQVAPGHPVPLEGERGALALTYAGFLDLKPTLPPAAICATGVKA